MIKKLDKLIIRSFIGPFFATFLIAVFVLVMQIFWLWIDDLVGKGLDMLTIGKFILITMAIVIPLALPLSLLLSSIMTFGKLGETFELVAIRSAGISLERFMRPLLIIAILLSGVAFVFSNNVIPVANLKQTTLMTNIITTKPAVDFKPGVFYDKIEGYIIRIGYKDKANKNIGDVVIFEKNYNGLQDDIITAKAGTMEMTPDKLSMQFTLRDGYMYQESGEQATMNTQLTRTHFQTYQKIFDMSSFKFNQMGEDAYRGNPKMLSLRQLLPRKDSLVKADTLYATRIRMALRPYFKSILFEDSTWYKSNKVQKKTFINSLSDSMKSIVYERALSQLTSAKNSIGYVESDYEDSQKDIRAFLIEVHRKFTLSVACFVLFMIGAPLGSIIRKGGLGSPLVFSIIFFVLFYLLNTIGERLARAGSLSPFTGMWLSSFILLPIGLFLTYKAMRDSQLFNNEAYFRMFKKIRSALRQKNKK